MQEGRGIMVAGWPLVVFSHILLGSAIMRVGQVLWWLADLLLFSAIFCLLVLSCGRAGCYGGWLTSCRLVITCLFCWFWDFKQFWFVVCMCNQHSDLCIFCLFQSYRTWCCWSGEVDYSSATDGPRAELFLSSRYCSRGSYEGNNT